MTQHTCAVCRHTFGKSTFPGGSTTYCSRACGTRWGTALLPKSPPIQPSQPPKLEPVTICTALLAIRHCVKCGSPLSLPYRRGRKLTQCRGGCAPAPRERTECPTPPPPPTVCKTCGGPIAKPRRGKVYCRTRCRIKGNPRRCDIAGCGRPHQAQGLCNHHYNERAYPDSRGQWSTDPDAKRKRDLVKSKRRRAATRGVHAENVDRDAVGKRDGWRCGVCRRRVDRTLLHPDPMSPSLDHVIPLSEGGPHTYANTRIAHLHCNIERSNRGGGEQLALIG